MQEMSSAWQMTVDIKLGLFAEDKMQESPLIIKEGETRKPNPPFVLPHNMWTKVSNQESQGQQQVFQSVYLDASHYSMYKEINTT